MGRYTESEIMLPEEAQVQDIVRMEDGRLRIVGMSMDTSEAGSWKLWDSTDGGKTWEEAAKLPEEMCIRDRVKVLNGIGTFSGMRILVCAYVAAIATVQISRYIKRFYVRRFANNVNRRMKRILYHSLVRKSRMDLAEEGEGDVMTKAILDVDDCVEGMRKFTTEIFDTGVALTAYIGMLLWYDWRLALLCLIFPPVSYTHL